MEYRIIDITWNYAPERLKRTIAVRQDIDLVTFAYIIVNAFLESPANGFALYKERKHMDLDGTHKIHISMKYFYIILTTLIH